MQKRKRLRRVCYWLDWKSKHFYWNVYEWKATPAKYLRVFSRKFSKWEPCRICNTRIQTLNFTPIQSPFQVIIEELLPFCQFSSFKNSLVDSNLVDLSFEYRSFSNKRKTTIPFPSPLEFLQSSFHNFIFQAINSWI